jgi:hypothetical protein
VALQSQKLWEQQSRMAYSLTVVDEILGEVRDGIEAKDKAFGTIECSPSIWLLNIMDGLGEIASEVVLNECEASPDSMDWDLYREGLVEIAIGAVLAVESIDRDGEIIKLKQGGGDDAEHE